MTCGPTSRKPCRKGCRSRKRKEKIVRLEPERKIFTDLVRMAAYRAESVRSPVAEPQRRRRPRLPPDPELLPTPDGETLTVRFQSMSQPRFNKALRDLCEITARECRPERMRACEGPKLFS